MAGITKCRKKLLQRVTVIRKCYKKLLQRVTGITKSDGYYKVEHINFSVLSIIVGTVI